MKVFLAALVAIALSVTFTFGGCGGSHGSGGAPASTFVMAPAAGTALPPGTTAAAYMEVFSVLSGGTPPYTFTPISIPQGLTLTPVAGSGTDVQLSGTPKQMGSSTVSFQVVDSTNQKVSNESYTLAIN